MARFALRASSSLLRGRRGLIVPFYTVQDCSLNFIQLVPGDDRVVCHICIWCIHGCWPRPHHITINLWRQDILYHAVYWNAAPLNWRNCSSNNLRLLHPESSSAVTLLLHADWMMLKNASNQGGANSVTVLSTRSWSLRKLHFSKIIWRLALGISMDLRLNATRRSINQGKSISHSWLFVIKF